MSEKELKKTEAAALKFDPENDDAPIAVAVGQGAVAERIIDTAMESDVPVVEDANLAHMLNKMRVGEQIPPQLYAVVAQILIFVGDMDDKYKLKVES